MQTKQTIRTVLRDEPLATAVYDRGRRGNPLPGCDCVQCFGYCMIDGDEAMRARAGNEDRGGDGE